MLKNIINCFSVCFALIIAPLSNAAEINQLDQSMVKINDQTAKAKQKALQQTLRNIFFKNSGNKDVLSASGIRSMLKKPLTLLRQFSYQNIAGQQYLLPFFNHQKIIQLLDNVQIPTWRKQRSLPLIWFTQKNKEKDTIIGDSSTRGFKVLIVSRHC